MKKLDNLSSDFVLSIVTEKNMSLNTAASYEADLKIFFSFMKVQDLGIASIRKTNISNFKEKEVSQIIPFPEDYLLSNNFLNS
ncbi:site-specific integrase [Paracoccaceae bacterium]|nr:site-specific integrase [Paracoccaceae bacterium]